MFQTPIKFIVRIAAFGILTLFMSPSFAHSGSHTSVGFVAGLMHPLSGLDHILAMFAIGLWAAQNKRPAQWLLPILFPLIMACGAVLGIAGVYLSAVEVAIACSVVALGVLVACRIRMPVLPSCVMVALFALVHGHAHGIELQQGMSIAMYAAGFMVTTALLHVAGLMIGSVSEKNNRINTVRLVGSLISATGIYFLIG